MFPRLPGAGLGGGAQVLAVEFVRTAGGGKLPKAAGGRREVSAPAFSSRSIATATASRRRCTAPSCTASQSSGVLRC